MPTKERKPPVYLLVLAGGSGTRFWPKSTSKKPKQFLSFDPKSKDSLLKQTLKRFDGWIPPKDRWILTTKALSPLVKKEAGKNVKVLAEPEPRNTAPCLYWAARLANETDPEATLMVMSSDHWIPEKAAFLKTLKEAVGWAQTHDDLVTLGVKPDRPETGYGYIEVAEPLGEKSKGFQVKSFVEKPNLETAMAYLAGRKHLWNGGMFVWKARVLLEAFSKLLPEYDEAWVRSKKKLHKVYGSMKATSIDYAVLEKSENVVTFSLDCGWDDLGSWNAMERFGASTGRTRSGNTALSGELLSIDSFSNIVDVPEKKVALLGVKDLVIVEHDGVLLVCTKERAQEVKRFSQN